MKKYFVEFGIRNDLGKIDYWDNYGDNSIVDAENAEKAAEQISSNDDFDSEMLARTLFRVYDLAVNKFGECEKKTRINMNYLVFEEDKKWEKITLKHIVI